MGGKVASRPKEVVLYLDRNGVVSEIALGLRNGCLVVAVGRCVWKGVLFFCVVHLEHRRSLALWVLSSCCKKQLQLYGSGEIDPLVNVVFFVLDAKDYVVAAGFMRIIAFLFIDLLGVLNANWIMLFFRKY